MDRRKIRYMYEVIFGIGAMVSCGILSILIKDITLASFILTIIIVCLASVVKITLVEDSPRDIKVVFNGICLYHYNLCISYFFALCIQILNKNNNIAFTSIWLYGNILNLVTPILVLGVIKKGKDIDALINIVSIVSVVIIFICASIKTIDIPKQVVACITHILVIGSNIVYVFLAKTVIYKSSYQGRWYYNAFLVCRVLEYIVICISAGNPNIAILCLNIQVIQIYFILKSALVSCIDDPRNMTFTALEEVEDKIDSHNTANKIIVNLSHELKTPVNIIRSAVDLLLLDCHEKELKSGIADIKEECMNIMNVIQLMIDIQKLKSGTCIIRNKVYNIVTIVENTIDAISGEYMSGNLLFNPKEEEMFANIDMQLFQQGLLGLFSIVIQDNNTNPIYVEMRKVVGENIYIDIFTESSIKIGDIIREVEDFKYQENIVGLLEVQYLQEILHMHRGEIQYMKRDGKDFIEIKFPCSEYSQMSEVPIDENNIYELREKIKCSYLVG